MEMRLETCDSMSTTRVLILEPELNVAVGLLREISYLGDRVWSILLAIVSMFIAS